MKRKLINYNNFIILLFLIVCFVTIHFHEMWFDEAQSWLIARDLSFSGIFKQMVYEGHSCLFFYYLKILILLGVPYKYLDYFSLFFCLIAVTLVLYKSPFNRYINTLLVFTPSFIYYCPVFARPYAFSLLFFILICILYKERYNHPFLLGIILFLFINTHLLTVIFTGSLMIIEIYEYFFKDKKYFKERVIMGCMSLLGVIFFAIQLLGSFDKRSDIIGGIDIRDIFGSFISIFDALFLGNVFFFIITMVLLFFLVKAIVVNKKVLFIILFNTICYMIFASIYYIYTNKAIYIMMYFLFSIWIFYEDGEKKECNKIFIIILLISCIASFGYIRDDIVGNYSVAKSLTDYLKKDDRNKIKVLTIKYSSDFVALLDDRFEFISFSSGKKYTYCPYDLDFSNVNNDMREFIIDNSIDYVITSSLATLNHDKIEMLVEEGFLSLEEKELSYVDSELYIVYKVN